MLTAPYEARKGGLFTEDSKEGAQGYLKVTMTLVGPGDDEALGETPEEEAKSEAHEVCCYRALYEVLFPCVVDAGRP